MEKLLVCLLCRGHALIEDVPGLGKTILARALAAALGGTFSRIQCTPDLLPADILGVSVYSPRTGEFTFRQGPIVAQIVLVDEINRATPRTQSALLQAMAEGQISVEGQEIPLPEPFLVLATENPVEFEGTFSLPEAQRDRFFMSLAVGYPDRRTEQHILESQNSLTHPLAQVAAITTMAELRQHQAAVVGVYVDQVIIEYILDIVEATRQDPQIRLGVSPRGSLALHKGAQAMAALHGRDFVLPDDVKQLVIPVCNQRLLLNPEASIRGLGPVNILENILDRIPVPVVSQSAHQA
jgi:MoxR-like ATPase